MHKSFAWKSPIDPTSFLGSTCFPDNEISLSRQDDFAACDLAVIDVRAYPAAQEFESALQQAAGVPKLILVDNRDSEISLIRRGLAEPMDELCCLDRAAEELLPRFGRLLGRCGAPRDSSTTDSLTGLINRKGFLARAESLLASASERQPISVLVIDIDRFKQVNDQLGHSVGDRVLRRVADVLKRSARGAECIARVGGDEFLVLASASLDQATGLAEFLRQEVEKEEFEEGVRTTISIGIDTATEPIAEDALWARADACVYRAKENGRNRVVTSEVLHESPDGAESDADFLDFETRIRVITERFGEELALRGKRMARRYREEAERDGLTGLFNRRYLDRRLPREMENAVRYRRKLSLIMLDLDHFGEVNRMYGYPGGDRVLKLLAGVVRTSTRNVDWAARYGGEEFCLVMPDTPLSEGVMIAERLRIAISAECTHAVDGREIRTTASLGVVELDGEMDGQLDDHPPDMVALIQSASDKVRQAKNGGRDRVCF
jgi:two-component system cell cycle response regulator